MNTESGGQMEWDSEMLFFGLPEGKLCTKRQKSTENETQSVERM